MDSCIDSFSCTDSKLAATTKQGIKAKIRTQLWATCEDSGLSASTITRDPLYPSSTKNNQVDRDNNNLGESNMIKEKVIKNLELLEVLCGQKGQM